ncbi:hypothetical protein J14TS2_24040 [Bacillus sp. J14TS2]|uniref:hypothetical protein n=1 Tax=Bacillus sp. J14TS2 TaxID=2807188 RepID=UPI001B01EB6F|nr:hypothetical protein [Bacillus sp. J14TS2]GIN71929.1 hypothetical protein J14TS2_24040 [Bacillus sp. J14TS2]
MVKIVGITILYMVLLIPATMCINIFFYGSDIKEAILNWVQPLYLRTISENLLYIVYPLSIICYPIVSFFLNKKRNTS